MKLLKELKLLYLVLVLLVLHSCSLCYAEKSYTITEAQMTELKKLQTEYRELQTDYEQLQKDLKTQTDDLKNSLKTLKKQERKNNVRIGCVCFGVGCSAGVVAGVIISCLVK